MGPKLNLNFLTPDECEKIIDVIQKDLILQHVEQQRISKINEEIRDINEFCKILGKQNSFNESYCLYCLVKFRLFFRKKFTCRFCDFNFCSNCIFEDQHGGNVCSFCLKKWQCQKQSLEWFYLRARSKFRRSGSSKVIKWLSLKSPFTTVSSKSQSLDSLSKCLDIQSKEGIGDIMDGYDPEGIKSKEEDLESLTERLMNVQSSCLEENGKMKTHIAELISMEKSLSEMDDVLKSLDNSLLEDHHHHHGWWSGSCNHQHSLSNPENCCLCHCTNETMLNLAANQISDITTVAAGVLEKTLNKACEIIKEHNPGYGDERDRDQDDGATFDDVGYEFNDPEGSISSDDSTEKVDQSEDLSCSEETESVQSVIWVPRDKKGELKSAEQEVYKVTSKTYILGERLTDLEDKIIITNGEMFPKKVAMYEEEVAELAVEINTNSQEAEMLQRKVAVI